jgi:ribosomal protein S18 acetylase RimI-like enzyme
MMHSSFDSEFRVNLQTTPCEHLGLKSLAQEWQHSSLFWTFESMASSLGSTQDYRLFSIERVAEEKWLGMALFLKNFDFYELIFIFISETMRGRGLSHYLLASSIQKLNLGKNECIHLEVRRSNITAIGLYKKLGFLQTGVRKGYYSNGEDGIMMTFDQATI